MNYYCIASMYSMKNVVLTIILCCLNVTMTNSRTLSSIMKKRGHVDFYSCYSQHCQQCRK